MHPMIKLLNSNRKAGDFKVSATEDGDSATIYLYDMIVDSEVEAEWWGGVSPKTFIEALNSITARTIHLRVNCPGGSVFAARAMEQAIREHSSEIIVHVDGVAASAASFLIMAARRIEMAPGSFIMIHKAWTIASGNADELIKRAELLNQVDGTLVKSYAARSNLAEEVIVDMMAKETWLVAEDAVRDGFADSVSEEPTASNKKTWNLSAYGRAPAATKTPDKQENHVDRAALKRGALKALIPA